MTARMKDLAQALLPDQWYAELRKRYEPGYQSRSMYLLRKSCYFGKLHFCPICESHLRTFLPFGRTPRPNAQCPVCGSLERHRLVFLFLKESTDLFRPPKKRMLHAAPADCLARVFMTSPFINYTSTNLTTGAMIKMDLTSICFSDLTFDVAFVSHVFEHIPDDRRAIREVFRVLKARGWAILQVPIHANTTFEDPCVVDPEERERVFGRWDHVRIYGEDYYDRLREVGFAVHRETLAEQADPEVARRLRLPSEQVVFCVKA